MAAVILEPPKIKSVTVFTASPSICHEVMGPDAMILVFWMLSFKPTLTAQTGSRTDVRPGLLSTHPLSPQTRTSVKFWFSSGTQSWPTVCSSLIVAHQACLSITNSQSLPKLMFIESVMPTSHLILCRPLLLPSIFPSIRVFSNESVLCIRWPK